MGSAFGVVHVTSSTVTPPRTRASAAGSSGNVSLTRTIAIAPASIILLVRIFLLIKFNLRDVKLFLLICVYGTVVGLEECLPLDYCALSQKR